MSVCLCVDVVMCVSGLYGLFCVVLVGACLFVCECCVDVGVIVLLCVLCVLVWECPCI